MANKPVAIQEPHCTSYHFKRMSWSAVFVGALVGVGLGFLLDLFAVAIGLSAVSVNNTGGMVIAIGGVLGIFIAVVAAMIVAGYAAGYLGRLYCPRRNLGILYGFTTWTVALLLSAAVTAHVSNYMSTYANTHTGSSVVMSQNAKGDVNGLKIRHDGSSAREAKDDAKFAVSSDHLASGAFLLFALFFVGAFSSCLGACWAMSCRRED